MSGRIIHQLESNRHDSDVTSLKFYNGNLYSSGGDGKIKVCN